MFLLKGLTGIVTIMGPLPEGLQVNTPTTRVATEKKNLNARLNKERRENLNSVSPKSWGLGILRGLEWAEVWGSLWMS